MASRLGPLPRLEGRFVPVLRVSDLDASVAWYAAAVGLLVTDRAELSAREVHLDSLGIPHSGIKEPVYSRSAMITVRDPDRIQVELFCVER